MTTPIVMPGDDISWTLLHDVAARIDQLYEARAIDYENSAIDTSYQFEGPLLESKTEPYGADDTIAEDFWLTFQTQPSPNPSDVYPLVTGVYATKDGVSDYFTFADFDNGRGVMLHYLASQGELYFLTDEDGCHCKTIYRVVPVSLIPDCGDTDACNLSRSFRLVEVGAAMTAVRRDMGPQRTSPASGALTSIEVPRCRTALDGVKLTSVETENLSLGTYTIIPGSNPVTTAAGITCNCQTLPVPRIGEFLDESQQIIPAAWASTYNVRHVGGQPYQLLYASRALSGKFTWTIRPRFISLLLARLRYASASLLAATDTNIHQAGVFVTPYVRRGCQINLESACKTLQARSTSLSEDLIQSSAGSICCNANPNAPLVTPWSSNTCGGAAPATSCSNAMPLYADTVNSFHAVLDLLESSDLEDPVYAVLPNTGQTIATAISCCCSSNPTLGGRGCCITVQQNFLVGGGSEYLPPGSGSAISAASPEVTKPGCSAAQTNSVGMVPYTVLTWTGITSSTEGGSTIIASEVQLSVGGTDYGTGGYLRLPGGVNWSAEVTIYDAEAITGPYAGFVYAELCWEYPTEENEDNLSLP